MEPVDFRYEYKKIRIDLRPWENLEKCEISSQLGKILKPLSHAGWSAENDSEWKRVHRWLIDVVDTDDLVFVLTFARWNPK